MNEYRLEIRASGTRGELYAENYADEQKMWNSWCERRRRRQPARHVAGSQVSKRSETMIGTHTEAAQVNNELHRRVRG